MSVRAAGLLLFLLPVCAWAQTSFGIGAVSDYRVRGISLSDGLPAAQATLNVDSSSGLYAGALVSRARLRLTRTNALATAYAGYAQRFGEGWSWDVGATHTAYQHGSRYDYNEVYVGAGVERLQARLAWSPHYVGVGGRTVYAELNGSLPLGGPVDLVAHAGRLRVQSTEAEGYSSYYSYRPVSRNDLRVGVSAALDAWSAQLTWCATSSRAMLYPGSGGTPPHALTLGLSRSF